MRSKLELLKLFSSYDGEVSMSDFSPSELEARLASADGEEVSAAYKRAYFDYYDDVKSPSLKKQDW